MWQAMVKQALRALVALRHDRLLVALCGATAGMIIWYAADVGTRSVQVIGAWMFIAVIHAALIVVARSMARTPGLTRAARRFWWAVAIAGIIYLTGDLVQVATAALNPLAAHSATGGPVQTGALSLGSAWLGLALLMSPLGFSSRKERERFWLDVATVMVAAIVVGWYLVVPDRPAALLDAAAPVLMGPVILLLCVFVVAKLTMSGTAPFTKWTAAFGIVASVAKSGADAIGTGGLAGDRLHWFLAATVASHALLTIAVRVNQVQVTSDPGLLRVRRRRPYSLLPYCAIAVTYVLLIVAVLRNDHNTLPTVLGGAAVSTGLVIVRQLAAFRENARLLEELDTNITELHRTQAGLHKSLAERDELAARLRHQAFHDGLTGLPNRTLYAQRLEEMLAVATPGRPVAVMLIDLDDFKLVNDAYGHAAGDALLCTIADRLRACVRAGDTVARLGGDEFAILLEPVPGSDPREIAARIVTAVEAPVAVDGGIARVGASIGIALSQEGCLDGAVTSPDGLDGSLPAGSRDGSPDGALAGEDLLRAADHAMYEVKRGGKGTIAFAGQEA
jgi:diguanylate cyclase (GGDEF)-like protein